MLLKIIVAILAAIGAIVVIGIVAIAVLYILIARKVRVRVRQSLREFESLHRGTLDAAAVRHLDGFDSTDYYVPPMRIKLSQIESSLWDDEPIIDEVTEWMKSNDFEAIGDFHIEEIRESRLRVFLSHDRRLVAAFRQEDLEYAPYVEFCFDLGQGKSGGVSNPPMATVPLPDGAVGAHFKENINDGLEFLPNMLKRAKKLATENNALPVDREKIKNFFEQAHAVEMDCRIARGGLSKDEILQALEVSQDDINEDDVDDIQWNWQDAIEHFLIEQSPKGLQQADDSGEVIAVYDASSRTYLYERLYDYYCLEWSREEFEEIATELESMLKKFNPREALARFRPLLPESMRYALIDQVRKPVEADLYLLPVSE